jgi:membrane-bound inhibitor of C-type lysozyme
VTPSRAAAALLAGGLALPCSAATTTLVYLCEGARTLAVVQPAPPRPGDAVELVFGEQARRMAPAVAASGARYLSADGAWEWWSKGPTGRLATAAGVPLAERCTLYPPTGKVPVRP